MEKIINCSILTPEKLLFEGEISSAIVHAADGEMGILKDHAPLVSKLGLGEVKLTKANVDQYFLVEGGLVEVNQNKIIILAENAFTKEELDATELDKKLSELENSISESEIYSTEKSNLVLESNKVKARLKLSKK